MKQLRVWISTGEISGDMHGAALLKALHSIHHSVEAFGMGGEALQEAGQRNIFHIRHLSIVGFTEILGAIPRIFRLLRQTGKALQQYQIDALILIDAPSFNLRLGAIAAKLGIPVYYHIAPKVWASRPRRALKLKAICRQIYCILPFEEKFFQKYGLSPDQAIFIGNPLLDMIDNAGLENVHTHPNRIGLMPGSRHSEVQRLMPEFAKAACLLAKKYPHLHFVCIQAPGISQSTLQELWHKGGASHLPCEFVTPDKRYAFMKSCFALMQASGTATLEAAIIGTPSLIAYKVSKLTEILMRAFIQVKFAGLPNLILNKELLPECLQEKACGSYLANCMDSWLTNPKQIDYIRKELAIVRNLCGPAGSAQAAATLLLEDLLTLKH